MTSVVETKQLFKKIAELLIDKRQHLTDLDQEIGDGDMGITMAKIGEVLLGPDVQESTATDVGVFLIETGMAANRAAASTMGTLVATGLMGAGKTVKGSETISRKQIAEAFQAAIAAVQKRGKAKLGDKTIVDAVHPAAEAFSSGVASGSSVAAAMKSAAIAAENGRDRVTPTRSKIGRAGWVGERTEGKVDAGCEMAAIVLRELGS